MVILTGLEVSGKLQLLCSVCQDVVGLFWPHELAAMSRDLDAVYCFNCDRVNADSVHPCLYDEAGRYLIYISGSPVSIDVWGEVKLKNKLIQARDLTITELFTSKLLLFGVNE